MRKSLAVFRPGGVLINLAMIAGLVFFGAAKASSEGAVVCPQPHSDGVPVINQQHVFCGEVLENRAQGFHSRPSGHWPIGVTLRQTTTTRPRGPYGVYVLRGFDIAQHGVRATKTLSTMFPDACSQAKVVAAIQHAFNNGELIGRRFRGPSGASCQAGNPAASFDIVGYMDATGTVVTTAFPDY